MRCDFRRVGDLMTCRKCGKSMHYVGDTTYNAKCLDCPHLGPPRTGTDGVPIKVKCNCTKKAMDRRLSVHTCEIFQRCLPGYPWQPDSEQGRAWAERKPESDIYKICGWCEHNPANQAATSGSS